MKINVYAYLKCEEMIKEIQDLIANTLFNEDYHSLITIYLKLDLIIEALKMNNFNVDLIILPADEEGMSIAAKIRNFNRNCTIIYIDGTNATILNAFNTLPIAFVPKNSSSKNFISSLKKALEWIETGKSYFYFESKTDILNLPYESIEYFESEYRIVHVHLMSNNIETFTAKLDDVQNILPYRKFCRCHKSYLVNLSHIKHLDKGTKIITLKSGKKIYSSKSCYPVLLKMLAGGDCVAANK